MFVRCFVRKKTDSNVQAQQCEPQTGSECLSRRSEEIREEKDGGTEADLHSHIWPIQGRRAGYQQQRSSHGG